MEEEKRKRGGTLILVSGKALRENKTAELAE